MWNTFITKRNMIYSDCTLFKKSEVEATRKVLVTCDVDWLNFNQKVSDRSSLSDKKSNPELLQRRSLHQDIFSSFSFSPFLSMIAWAHTCSLKIMWIYSSYHKSGNFCTPCYKDEIGSMISAHQLWKVTKCHRCVIVSVLQYLTTRGQQCFFFLFGHFQALSETSLHLKSWRSSPFPEQFLDGKQGQ